MPLSTVSGILTRIGMGKLGRLGLEPAVRYEHERPGELIHIDIKRLGTDPARRRLAVHWTGRPQQAANSQGPPRRQAPDRGLGVRAHRDR